MTQLSAENVGVIRCFDWTELLRSATLTLYKAMWLDTCLWVGKNVGSWRG